jgi:eukaryotic-like serine/threonine-protein kinase
MPIQIAFVLLAGAMDPETVTVKEGRAAVTSVVFSPDGMRIASGGGIGDNTVTVRDATNGQTIFSAEGHSNQVACVKFSPDGKLIASGSWDHTVRVWNATTGKAVLTIKWYAGPVTSVAFSPDGKRIASGSWNHTFMGRRLPPRK